MIKDDVQLKAILTSVRTVASVGVSANEDKPSNGIFSYLKEHGYHMIPVNPTASEVHGEKVYADLFAITEPVDVVQIFRKSEDVPPVVEAAIKIGAKVVWMQKGIVNVAAANMAEAAGLQVVMDRCMFETHLRLIGG